MTRFRALQMSLDVIVEIRDVVDVVRRRSRDLADQMERAATSVALNVAEASRRTGKDRAYRFRVANGSADEVRCALKVAVAWRYVQESDVRSGLQLLDDLAGMLWALSGGRRCRSG